MVRWVLGGIAAVVAGGIFLGRYLAPLPALDQLTSVQGNVVSADVEITRTRRMKSEHLAVQIGTQPVAFYLGHFPDFERISGSIKPGDQVRAWVDKEKNRIWQLDKGKERLVGYDQVVEAHKSNERGNALFGILFVVVGLGTLGVMFWRWRTGSQGSAPAEAASGTP